jgi:hypothetical protein
VLAIAGLVVTLLFLGGGYRAFRRNRHSQLKQWVVWTTLCLGIAAGLFLGQVSYPVAEDTRVLGLPMPVAAFQRRNGQWLDFVSPLTPILYLVNVVAWGGVAQLVLALATRSPTPRGPSPSPTEASNPERAVQQGDEADEAREG